MNARVRMGAACVCYGHISPTAVCRIWPGANWWPININKIRVRVLHSYTCHLEQKYLMLMHKLFVVVS